MCNILSQKREKGEKGVKYGLPSLPVLVAKFFVFLKLFLSLSHTISTTKIPPLLTHPFYAPTFALLLQERCIEGSVTYSLFLPLFVLLARGYGQHVVPALLSSGSLPTRSEAKASSAHFILHETGRAINQLCRKASGRDSVRVSLPGIWVKVGGRVCLNNLTQERVTCRGIGSKMRGVGQGGL